MPCTAERPAAASAASDGPQPPRRQAPAQHDRNHRHMPFRRETSCAADAVAIEAAGPHGALRSESGHNPC